MARTRYMIRRQYGDGRGWLFTARFWRDALERAVRNAAGLALTVLGVGSVTPGEELAVVTPEQARPLIELGLWQLAGIAAAVGLVLSLLTSLAAGMTGERGTAAFVPPRA